MKLEKTHAESLCEQLLNALSEQEHGFRAVLQAAGCERKFEGCFQVGMTNWLEKHAHHLCCITEYCGLDFAFIRKDSVGTDRLVVDTLFESKFNYTSQNAELINRPAKASQQLDGYLKNNIGIEGYLIYLMADHRARLGSSANSDRGWLYINTSVEGRFQNGVRRMQESCHATGLISLSGLSRNFDTWDIHLEIFEKSSLTNDMVTQPLV